MIMTLLWGNVAWDNKSCECDVTLALGQSFPGVV